MESDIPKGEFMDFLSKHVPQQLICQMPLPRYDEQGTFKAYHVAPVAQNIFDSPMQSP
jgi:hypothetical protein